MELLHKFTISVGDEYDDGHGKYKKYVILSNKPLKEVEKALKAAKKKYPKLNPENYCRDYEDSKIDKKTMDALIIAGYPEDKFDNIREDTGEQYVGSDDMLNITLFFLTLGDPELNLVEMEEPEALDITIGYGCFY